MIPKASEDFSPYHSDPEDVVTTPRSSEELIKEKGDVEAQPLSTKVDERQISLRTKFSYLGAWFLLNLILTISNKAVLAQARFPWLLTTLHTSVTSLGCFMFAGFGSLKATRLKPREDTVLVAFSVLFTANIATSNVSLALVSVPLHQVMRSTCPVVTILIYRMLGKTYSTATYLSIIPLVFGVGLATFGDYYCTLVGGALTMLGVVLAAAKTVATNRLMVGPLKLGPLEVLLRMSPLATIQCVFCAFVTGEVGQAHLAYVRGDFSGRFALALVANGLIAFALNIVSFAANRAAGGLTMTVAGNIKQVLTILLGILLFNVQTGPLNAIGTAITVLGAAWYSWVELDTKRKSRQPLR